ncbi:L-asparaginase II protein [Corynespora cassiicola Philippines]|uniref:L-asparaginase II protein n=1 Tax=Corynespora cassiicola Philippines TaxID=1448308 RepID=A0A2T2NJE1_CORCC|nr:L-asparaginase II protein [Corynespora cassiicola Philippines]
MVLSPSSDRIFTTRGTLIESTHLVHAAITSSSGDLLYTVGNASRPTLLRSSVKPAQTLAILEACRSDPTISFSTADLALMSASHSSEPRHVSRAAAMLEAVGASESDLECGGHAALSAGVNREWIKRDFIPGGLCNNCSGKHAGMLAGAKALGAGFAGYHLPSHPMQERVKRVVEEVAGLPGGEDVQWAVDGCNLPAPAMPLSAMAGMYARFAGAVESPRGARGEDMKRIFEAMYTHPELVGGEGRFCTQLMDAYGGLLIGKLGADGCYGIGVRESEFTKRLGVQSGGVGIAVKVEDGNIDMLYAAVMDILAQLDIGEESVRTGLQGWHSPPILNTMGVVTGRVSHSIIVRKEK